MKVIFLLLCLLLPVKAAANDIELSGLVIDRTISRFGKDFMFYYSGYWRDMPATEGVSVVIYEQVYPQAGTFLWVEMNQQRVYQTYFGRRYNNVKEMAEQAILRSINELANIQASMLLGSQDQEIF
ncbi:MULTISPECIES: curli production assembly/transport protein CsgE [unclassified Arsukibacterium]|uniref:curli production assembly/transport protein CsgE n=1 Tax=unclassified Arsukibacterium TaxID=2635278 RepID=UPI000C4D3A89|nr:MULTISPECIES: curli production assembly/transport protein CsgE [unclassified Arsukibacterium]MAA93939.1 curli production assembly protein CsgE [Rheinheimera sp.]MBM33280.1 curli production assembly protein CsgE [Rheinheimera sp.]|tara:strand:+ start:56 stop:433 length:378 start_codon:yes stop_codon:yes gene_type:complete